MCCPKSFSLALRTHTGWKWRDGKRYSRQTATKKKKKKKQRQIIGKIDSKLKIVKRDKSYYIKIKASINQYDIAILNIYAPNIRAPKYIKQALTELKKKKAIVRAEEFLFKEFSKNFLLMYRWFIILY